MHSLPGKSSLLLSQHLLPSLLLGGLSLGLELALLFGCGGAASGLSLAFGLGSPTPRLSVLLLPGFSGPSPGQGRGSASSSHSLGAGPSQASSTSHLRSSTRGEPCPLDSNPAQIGHAALVRSTTKPSLTSEPCTSASERPLASETRQANPTSMLSAPAQNQHSASMCPDSRPSCPSCCRDAPCTSPGCHNPSSDPRNELSFCSCLGL